MGTKFRIENGKVVRVSGPASKTERKRVRRNREALAAGVVAPRATTSEIERTVRRRINGEELSEAEFQARCADRQEQLDANLNGILESRQFPGVTGDDTTFQSAISSTTVEKRFTPAHLARMRKMASDAGVRVSPNAEYYPSLAAFDGDPKGWVNPTDTREDIRRRIAANGNGSKELGVKVRPPESDPFKRVHRLAPDLVKEMEKKTLAADPDLAANVRGNKKKRRELREKVIATHGAPTDSF